MHPSINCFPDPEQRQTYRLLGLSDKSNMQAQKHQLGSIPCTYNTVLISETYYCPTDYQINTFRIHNNAHRTRERKDHSHCDFPAKDPNPLPACLFNSEAMFDPPPLRCFTRSSRSLSRSRAAV